MAYCKDEKGILLQNLKDAGCCKETADTCMDFYSEGKPACMLPILCRCRCELLASIRAEQAKLDCLDYLIFKIKSETEGCK